IPASTAWTVPSAGTFYFQATYSGDANDTGPVSSPCASEALVVAASTTPSVSAVSASTAMTGGAFTTHQATASGQTGRTLVGGGDELTLAGTPVPNNGAVTLGLDPSDASGNLSADGATTPGSWTTTSGYAAQGPGTDTVTTYAMCASNITSATTVK